MRIYRHKKFKKRYSKLPVFLKDKVDLAILKFEKDPFDRALRNHGLSGRLDGKRAFWVTGNIRVVFEEYDDYLVVLMLNVGVHPQVYGG
ncbi:MAG: hypothetical protein V1679_00490 [Candidatus Peregrinibacteria bacterium]